MARHGERLVVIALFDQLGKTPRAGDIRALTNIDKVGLWPDHQRFEATQAATGFNRGGDAWRDILHRLANRVDMFGRRATAAADHIEQPTLGKFTQHVGHLPWRLIIFAKGIGQPGVGIDADITGGDLAEIVNILAQGARA